MKKSIILLALVISSLFSTKSFSQTEPFIAQISMFAGNFAPRGWAFCDGQLLAISSNTALFSLIGCQYGGDCRTTFALPDLRGRVPMHQGRGPGLTSRVWGQKFGAERTTLSVANLPNHNHAVTTSNLRATFTNGKVGLPVNNEEGNLDSNDPSEGILAYTETELYTSEDANAIYSGADVNVTGDVAISGNITTGFTGGQQSFNNVQPSLVINYIIALQGVFPSRQ